MKTLNQFLLFLFLSLSTSLFSQVIDTNNPSLGERGETGIDSIEISLAAYNKIRINSGLPEVDKNFAGLTRRKTIWFTHEVSLPEKSDDEDEFDTSFKGESSYDWTLPSYLPLGVGFEGISFNTDAIVSGFFHIPPDPSGAVGESHVGHVVNTSISFHTKSGVQVAGFPQSLQNFFTPLAPENGTFDPKILWDQYEDRFVVVTLVRTQTSAGAPSSLSRVLIAVSETSDPAGNWHFQAINAEQNIASNACWFDFPGFAVDDKAIYLSGNYFRLSDDASCNSSRFIIIDKGVSGGIYAGTTSTNEDPTTNGDFKIIDPVILSGDGFVLTNQPAHTFGSRGATEGTYFVGYSGLSDGTNDFLQVFSITNPLAATPTVSVTLLSMGDVDDTSFGLPNVPQSGNPALIAANDRRTLDAVWRDNKLWLTTQVLSNTAANNNQTTAFWARVNSAGTTHTFDAGGEIGGEDIVAGAFTWMPSIAVNSSGDAAIGFSASESSIFAGAYLAILDGATDGLGSSQIVKAGVDDYERTFGGDNRWGDYSATVLDPFTEDFWAINEAAILNGNAFSGEDGQWQVFIQEVEYCSPNLPNDVTETTANLSSGLYQAKENLSSSGTVEVDSNKNVEFKGGVSVVLNIGFHAKEGAAFRAHLDACTPSASLTQPAASFRANSNYMVSPMELPGLTLDIYPNPNHGNATIEYEIAEDEEVTLGLFNASGKLMDLLIREESQMKGKYSFNFNGDNLPLGFYFISLKTSDKIISKKLIISE